MKHRELEPHEAVPSLAPDREEIEQRQGSRPAGRKSARPNPPPRRPSFLLVFMVFILLLAVGGLGGWNYLIYQQLLNAGAQLNESAGRLQKLESRLVNTDASMTQSSDAVQGQLTELDSEVRKLWDNVWKKARVRLTEQDTAIDALQVDTQEMASRQSALDDSLAQLQISVGVLEEQVGGAASVAAEVAAISELIAAEQQQWAEAGSALQRAQQSNEANSQRLQEIDEWVASFNGYRTQINRKLLELQGAINTLQAP